MEQPVIEIASRCSDDGVRAQVNWETNGALVQLYREMVWMFFRPILIDKSILGDNQNKP